MGWFQRGSWLSLDFLSNAEFSPCLALPEYIRALIHSACLRVFSVTPWVGFKRSHWIHLGWWSTGSPKLQLFQLSQHSQVTNCRLISTSVYFPWNMILKYKIQLSESSWDKILHSKLKTQCFSKEEIFFLAVCLLKRYTKVLEVVLATSLWRLPRKVNNPFGTTPFTPILEPESTHNFPSVSAAYGTVTWCVERPLRWIS